MVRQGSLRALAGRRFLRVLGFSLFQAAVLGSAVGAIVSARVPPTPGFRDEEPPRRFRIRTFIGAPIGGLKVTTENAWFAARPSGTEDVYKIYAESFKGPDHLKQVQEEAREVVSAALAG